MDTDIDWGSLPFGYYPTDYNLRCTFRDGKWGPIEVSQSETVNIHMAATTLHYGQEIFEGLKAFRGVDGKIRIFRLRENAKRMRENYPYRVLDARWRQSAEGAFRVTIRIVAADTTGMANHITEVISRDLKLNIRSINFGAAVNGCVSGTVAVEVPGAGVADTLIHRILRIKGVQRAYRIN